MYKHHHKERKKHSEGNAAPATHCDNIKSAGYVDEEYFACVHTPVKDWRRIPKARDAVNHEKEKLEKRGAWNLKNARPINQVKK